MLECRPKQPFEGLWLGIFNMDHSASRLALTRARLLGEFSPEAFLRTGFWCVATIFGFLQAWNSRYVMNPDGISYLDLSDAYLHGGWKMLINGHWSPLYPWLLAITRAILPPSGYWEFTVVNLVNFGIFLFAAGTFELFLAELLRAHQTSGDASTTKPLPVGVVRSIAYLTFLWSSLTLIGVGSKSPDMLMSIFVYLALALLLRLRRSPGSWISFVFLGATLGFGYLAKAPMFPLAFVFISIALASAISRKQSVLALVTAVVVFGLISSPLIVGLSHSKGRLTFGDSGRWNYLTCIDRAGPVWYMQSEGSAGGKFTHPPQRIFDAPPVYAFVGPVGGTQPVWYDPSYWIEGARPRFDLHQQAERILLGAGAYFDLVFANGVPLLIVAAAFWWIGTPGTLARFLALWPVWVIAVSALCMYMAVLVEPRYVAVFLVALWLPLFVSVRMRAGRDARVAGGAMLALTLALGAPMLRSAAQDFYDGVVHHEPNRQWDLAQQLQRMGLRGGDLVGRVGGPHAAEWARLLRVRVIAAVPREQAEDFWSSTAAIQAQVIASFAGVGAKAVIAEQLPPYEGFEPGPGWREVGKTNYYVYRIDGPVKF